jgi:type II secretory pathway pseudopilin PulG
MKLPTVTAVFPLTPALSLGEREKRAQLHGRTTAGNCSDACGFYETGQRLFLLPKGEGQDEGVGSVNRSGDRLSFRNPQSAIRNGAAFSLVEVLLVISLLSLIVLALMTVFSSTQRAFRASVTQTDVLEGGRMAVDLISTDLRGLTPSHGVSNGPVNFSTVANSVYSGYYSPLAQKLPGSSMPRTNLLNYFFILGRENTRWIGTGYVVDNTNSSNLYPLYRYYRDDLSAQADPWFLFNEFIGIVNSGNWTNATMSHLMDGVVHLTVRAYDPAGRWINGHWIGGTFYNYTNAVNAQNNQAYGEAQLYMFSNTVPAAVELELGVLEDHAVARAGSLPNNLPAPPPLDRRTLFLQNQSGSLHLFRQRVTIPNVDPSAYQ